MKVTSIKFSSDVSSISVNVVNPGPTDPYLIKGITGLDADDIVQRFYAQAQNPHDLQYYPLYDMVLTKREVEVSVIPNPVYSANQTISQLRDNIYKMISASRFGDVTMSFFDGNVEKAILEGSMTKVLMAHFGDVPELKFSFLAKDPILRAPPKGRQYPAVSLLESNNYGFDIYDNLSTAPHGMNFAIKFTSYVTGWTLGNNDDGWVFSVQYPSGGFYPNDVLRFGSEYNNKYLFLNGYPEDPNPPRRHYAIIDLIAPNSVWPIMFPGKNRYHFVASTYTWLNWSYLPAYWGV